MPRRRAPDPCAFALTVLEREAAQLGKAAGLSSMRDRGEHLHDMAASCARAAGVVRTGFHRGMLAALACVAAHDAQTVYEEIVASAGARDLVLACEDREEAVWSGLVRYGYWQKYARYRPARTAAHDPAPTSPTTPDPAHADLVTARRLTAAERHVLAHAARLLAAAPDGGAPYDVLEADVDAAVRAVPADDPGAAALTTPRAVARALRQLVYKDRLAVAWRDGARYARLPDAPDAGHRPEPA